VVISAETGTDSERATFETTSMLGALLEPTFAQWTDSMLAEALVLYERQALQQSGRVPGPRPPGE
jgi:hypothetical protein